MTFRAGQTGNPVGRPKVADAAAQGIRNAIKNKDWEYMANALKRVIVLDDGSYNPDTSGKDKASAYSALSDRAFGKVKQQQDLNVRLETPVNQATLDELRLSMLANGHKD